MPRTEWRKEMPQVEGEGISTEKEALCEIARALHAVASALRDLGTGNAATGVGAIEFLARGIETGLNSAGEDIQDGLYRLAETLRKGG